MCGLFLFVVALTLFAEDGWTDGQTDGPAIRNIDVRAPACALTSLLSSLRPPPCDSQRPDSLLRSPLRRPLLPTPPHPHLDHLSESLFISSLPCHRPQIFIPSLLRPSFHLWLSSPTAFLFLFFFSFPSIIPLFITRPLICRVGLPLSFVIAP